jgi:hypothetical protein
MSSGGLRTHRRVDRFLDARDDGVHDRPTTIVGVGCAIDISRDLNTVDHFRDRATGRSRAVSDRADAAATLLRGDVE